MSEVRRFEATILREAGAQPGRSNDFVVLASDYDALRNAALGVANALHVGTGAMIRRTMMEDDLRKALGLKHRELWNFTTGKAEPSAFALSRGEQHGK